MERNGVQSFDPRKSSTFQLNNVEKYMEEHLIFNLQLEKFAFLTGISLTTFKRDFKNTFKSTPGKWLTWKRLELAYHKLIVQQKKIADVYLAVGFENVSHFSFAFKKQFRYTPSTVQFTKYAIMVLSC